MENIFLREYMSELPENNDPISTIANSFLPGGNKKDDAPLLFGILGAVVGAGITGIAMTLFQQQQQQQQAQFATFKQQQLEEQQRRVAVEAQERREREERQAMMIARQQQEATEKTKQQAESKKDKASREAAAEQYSMMGESFSYNPYSSDSGKEEDISFGVPSSG